MRIWEIQSSDVCMVVNLQDFRKDSDKFDLFQGDAIGNDWEPPIFEVYRKGKHRDFPHALNGILILTEKSLRVLNALIQKNVEYLPAINDEIKMTLVNVTTVIDCVDYSRAVPQYVSDGVVNGFDKLAFMKEKIINIPIFKIPEMKSKRIYVSDEFRNLILQSKLKGIEFNLAWDSEVTDEMEQKLVQAYEAKLAEIERNKGEEFGWDEAVQIVRSGKAVASGGWKLQTEKDGELLTGKLTADGSYSWVEPLFIPPILLDLKWHVVELSEL